MNKDLVRVYKFRIFPNEYYFVKKKNVYIPNEISHKLSLRYDYEEEDAIQALYFNNERLEALKNEMIEDIKNCKDLRELFSINCYDTDCYEGVEDEILFAPNVDKLILKEDE